LLQRKRASNIIYDDDDADDKRRDAAVKLQIIPGNPTRQVRGQ